jgi:hypothetical protein
MTAAAAAVSACQRREPHLLWSLPSKTSEVPAGVELAGVAGAQDDGAVVPAEQAEDLAVAEPGQFGALARRLVHLEELASTCVQVPMPDSRQINGSRPGLLFWSTPSRD